MGEEIPMASYIWVVELERVINITDSRKNLNCAWIFHFKSNMQ